MLMIKFVNQSEKCQSSASVRKMYYMVNKRIWKRKIIVQFSEHSNKLL